MSLQAVGEARITQGGCTVIGPKPLPPSNKMEEREPHGLISIPSDPPTNVQADLSHLDGAGFICFGFTHCVIICSGPDPRRLPRLPKAAPRSSPISLGTCDCL
jgi:hypothetical protein